MEIRKKHSNTVSFSNQSISLKTITPYLFIIPAFIALVTLFIYPLLYGVGVSFFNTNLVDKWKFVGLKNYSDFITNRDFISSMKITIAFTIVVVSLHFVIGTILALGLNKKGKGITIFRTILILPWVFPEVVSALVFKWILNPVYGILNCFLVSTGVIKQGVSWLGSEKFAFISVALVCIWKGFPLVMINVLAALQSVPEDIKEASKVDGANRYQTFFKIIVPTISPVLATVLILDIIWWFKHYTMVTLLTAGGPNNSTSLVSLEIYKRAFSYFDFGSAAAMSVVVFIVCFTISRICGRMFRDES